MLLWKGDARILGRAGHDGITIPVHHQASILRRCQALCHCADCRKISGGLYSHNVRLPEHMTMRLPCWVPVSDWTVC